MIRRSLRIGIRLGLLTGLVFVLFKVVQSRRTRPAPPDVDGWETPPDGQSRSSDPVLVRPTMPDRPVRPREQAPAEEAPAAPASVAPGPSEPFAMVEPDAAAPPAAEEVPLDAVAEVKAEVGDPMARAPQAEAAVPPAPAPAAKKQPPARRAARKAAKKAVKKAAARKATARKATAGKATAAKKAARKATAARAGSAKRAQGTAGWVEPIGGTCPSTHPVKAKMATRIFHLPGMSFYHRVSADRCYADAAAAENDGLRAAKR